MREVLARNRGIIAIGIALVVALVLLALVAGSGPKGTLDPDGYDPDGAHALAVLLRQQGVHVTRTEDVPSTLDAAGSDSTVFLPLPSLMSPQELQALRSVPGELVVAQAGPDELTALGARTRLTGLADLQDRDPGCPVPFAVNAGRALLGGPSYAGDGCYSSDGGASLLSLPEQHLTLLGAANGLTNAHLAEQGDAALGIGLLGRQPRLVWLVPSPTRPTFGSRKILSPDDLLPHWLHLVRWQLLVTLLVLAVWRGRRLGRVVGERLPVVVRAAETVEGHGRLYRAAGSRDAASAALREAARTSLARLGHGGTSVSPEALTELTAARTERDPGQVRLLLYGPTPVDDAALVRLAHDLDALTHQALTREAAGT